MNGSKWKVSKGCFGGSLPGKNIYKRKGKRNIKFVNTVKSKGTVGTKLFYKFLRIIS